MVATTAVMKVDGGDGGGGHGDGGDGGDGGLQATCAAGALQRQNAAFSRDFLRFLKASHMPKRHGSLHLPRN